jgi:LacI family transcriptional regulator
MAALPKKRATLNDVAKLAGVSLKTASNVKNEWPYVADATRTKVKAAMAALDYRPSHLAKSLVTGRSYTVGVVMPDIANPFFSTAFRGCGDGLTQWGYQAFLCSTDEDVDKETYYLDLLVNHGVDALLLWGSMLEQSVLTTLVDLAKPLISIGAFAESALPNCTVINVDNRGGAARITRHLIERGYRKIAHVGGPRQRLPAQLRAAGFCQAMADAGLAIEPAWQIHGRPTFDGGYDATNQLLHAAHGSSATRPDAIVYYNDLMAVGAIAAIQDLGLAVPDDFAIVGFDDTMPASLVTPRLTTVRIPQYELGQLAVDALIRRIEGKQTGPEVINVPVTLQIRESCGARRLDQQERLALLRDLVISGRIHPSA